MTAVTLRIVIISILIHLLPLLLLPKQRTKIATPQKITLHFSKDVKQNELLHYSVHVPRHAQLRSSVRASPRRSPLSLASSAETARLRLAGHDGIRAHCNGAGINKYGDLLPGKSHIYSAARQTTKASTAGGSSTQILMHRDSIATSFEIPLFLRQNSHDGYAKAKVIKSGNGLRFRYIVGSPYIRAVLFETLQRKSSVFSIKQLLKRLQTNFIIFKLSYTTAATSGLQNDTKINLEESTVSVVMTRHDNSLVSSAIPISLSMPLPDREADRAKERDLAALKRLKNSPAFVSNIRRYGFKVLY